MFFLIFAKLKLFTMRKILLLLPTLLLCQVLSALQSDTLYYKGELSVDNSQKLVLTLQIIKDKDSTCYLFGSPMQTKELYSPSKVKHYGDTLSLGFKKLNLVLKLRPDKEKKTLSGTLKQGFFTKDISLCRQSAPFAWKRPQTPVPPYRYRSKELSFKNPEAQYSFHGTLTYPESGNKFPLVVLVSGSGCQNRDEEIFGHKPFAVVADYLTRHGLAVFRYDDRGWGSDDLQLYKGTTYDFAKDALSAIEMLKHEQIIDTNQIGIFGHSEGGLIAQILSDKVSFLILAAAPAVSGKEILLSQGATIEEKDLDTNDINGYWLECFYRLDPKQYLSTIQIPTLVLQGQKDVQVLAEQNIPIMRQYLEDKATIKTYPGLNHLFQHCTSGEVSEYSQIEETFSEQVLSDILTFIEEHISITK